MESKDEQGRQFIPADQPVGGFFNEGNSISLLTTTKTKHGFEAEQVPGHYLCMSRSGMIIHCKTQWPVSCRSSRTNPPI